MNDKTEKSDGGKPVAIEVVDKDAPAKTEAAKPALGDAEPAKTEAAKPAGKTVTGLSKRKPDPTPDEKRVAQIARMAQVSGISKPVAERLVMAGIADPESLADLTDDGLDAFARSGEDQGKLAKTIAKGELRAKAVAFVSPKPPKKRA